jgi:hypothetical protein
MKYASKASSCLSRLPRNALMEAIAAACLFSFGSFASMQPEDQANHAALMTALRKEAVAKDPSWNGPSCVLTDKDP